MNIREITKADFEQVWPVLQDIAEAGETYAYAPDITKEQAYTAWVEAPRKIADVAPVYPSAARIAHIEGIVILEVIIGASGRVESARVLRSEFTVIQRESTTL